MHVSRIGFTPLKGTRHRAAPVVDLALEGPVGDRVFCLVDRARGRVLRTVEHPALMRSSTRWHEGVLGATLPSCTVEAVPEPTGERVELDYWGRPAALELVAGPWAAAYSELLGCDVELARAARSGEIVYGGSVSLVTTSTLRRLAEEVAAPVDPAQLRSTFTVDTEGEPAHVEDSWVGRRVRLGEAEVEVRSLLPRCAVVDLDPVTGERRSEVLRALAGYRRARGEVLLGVDAVVTSPGRVALDDVVERG